MHKHILVSRDLFPFQLESRFAITHSHVSSGHHRFPTAHNCKSGDLNDRIIFDCSVCSGRIFKAPGISKDDTVSKRDITFVTSPIVPYITYKWFSDWQLKRHIQSKCCDYLYSAPLKGTQAPCGVEGCLEGDPMIGLVQCDACSGLFCLKWVGLWIYFLLLQDDVVETTFPILVGTDINLLIIVLRRPWHRKRKKTAEQLLD
jgi:hypothetical protein